MTIKSTIGGGASETSRVSYLLRGRGCTEHTGCNGDHDMADAIAAAAASGSPWYHSIGNGGHSARLGG